MKFKNIVKLTGAALMAVGVILPMNTLAANDNIDFSFKIGILHANGKEKAGRYRQTTSTDNPWKVKLDSSGEGKGTVTRFWLENASAGNVSTTRNATQGKGAYYTDAYLSANKRDVWLTGENNNYNTTSYTVSGKWDEETW